QRLPSLNLHASCDSQRATVSFGRGGQHKNLGRNNRRSHNPRECRSSYAKTASRRGPMNNLLAAIVEDNRSAVTALLKADGGLATRLIQKPKLYRSKIFHWIYVGDTALHRSEERRV